MIASVAQGIPSDLEIERIHIHEKTVDKRRMRQLTLEGKFDDDQPGADFRKWVESIKEDVDSEGERLKLIPYEGGLRFRLEYLLLAGGSQL